MTKKPELPPEHQKVLDELLKQTEAKNDSEKAILQQLLDGSLVDRTPNEELDRKRLVDALHGLYVRHLLKAALATNHDEELRQAGGAAALEALAGLIMIGLFNKNVDPDTFELPKP